jgi:hypothetical protein
MNILDHYRTAFVHDNRTRFNIFGEHFISTSSVMDSYYQANIPIDL